MTLLLRITDLLKREPEKYTCSYTQKYPTLDWIDWRTEVIKISKILGLDVDFIDTGFNFLVKLEIFTLRMKLAKKDEPKLFKKMKSDWIKGCASLKAED